MISVTSGYLHFSFFLPYVERITYAASKKLAIHFGQIYKLKELNTQVEMRLYDGSNSIYRQGCPSLYRMKWTLKSKFHERQLCDGLANMKGQPIRVLVKYNHWSDYLWLLLLTHQLKIKVILMVKNVKSFHTTSSKANAFLRKGIGLGDHVRLYKWRMAVSEYVNTDGLTEIKCVYLRLTFG